MRVSPGAPVGRTELMQLLLEEGIATRRGVMAIHREAAYDGQHPDLPHTEAASDDTLMLPLFPDLDEADQDRVIDALATHLMARAA